MGSESGDPVTLWRPLTRPWRGPGVALAWPWRGPDVICGALVRCSFPAPTPPEPEREHCFFDAFEGIRVHPEGNACSGAGVGSKSGDPLTLWTPLARPWRGPGVALTWPWRVMWGAGAVIVSGPKPSRTRAGAWLLRCLRRESAFALRGTHARGQGWAPKVATLSRFGGLWRGPGAALARYVGRWCGARFRPQPLQNLSGSIVFSMPSKGSAFALRGTHARARDVKRFTLLLV